MPIREWVASGVITLVVAIGSFAAGHFSGRANVEHEVRVEERVVRVPVSEPAMVIRCSTKATPAPRTSSGAGPSSTPVPSLLETEIVVEAPVRTVTVAEAGPVLAPGSNVFPPWRVSTLAGYDFNSGIWAVGAGVEHHLGGPFYVGGWGLSSGAAGLSVSATF